jgi:hypothetical protein
MHPGLWTESSKRSKKILLKPKVPFEETVLDEVAGCLRFEGNAKSDEEIDQAI